MPYMKTICRAGRTKIISRYYTRFLQPKGRKRRPKVNKTSKRQQEINDRHLQRRLTALLNANFDHTCWYLTFDYEKENRPKDKETLHKQEQKLLRDLRRLYKKKGKALKYVWTAEVGERGGTHIHMVVSDMGERGIRDIRDLWPHGRVTPKPLDRNGQYSRLASYFIKYFQKTRGTDAGLQKKAYNPSKNLARPKVNARKMKGDKFTFDVKVPAGWYLDKDSVREGVTEDGYEFIYYILVKEGG